MAEDHHYCQQPNEEQKQISKNKHSGVCCSAVGCSNTQGPGIKFHRFSKREPRKSMWVNNYFFSLKKCSPISLLFPHLGRNSGPVRRKLYIITCYNIKVTAKNYLQNTQL